jgi:hypothetical protein
MSATSTDYVRSLESATRDTAALLRGLSEETVTWRPKAGAWSIKEIIGHLIDSAANNHQRFVRAEQQADLVFQGYAQDDWVRIQSYTSAPWNELVSLWESYNLHLARVMAAIPASVRDRKHAQHNFHQIGFREFKAEEPVSLDDLMYDYVLHLEHHLAQLRDRRSGAELAALGP